MLYEWNEDKRKANIEKHGIDFAAIEQFCWENATIFADQRMAYTEPRMVAYGYIVGRLVVAVYTMRHDVVRIISMRKANKREVNTIWLTCKKIQPTGAPLMHFVMMA